MLTEREANEFAAHLLISDDLLQAYSGMHPEPVLWLHGISDGIN